MYTRVKTFKNKDGSTREYLYIVESIRKNGKVKQRTVANLGRVDYIMQSGKMDALAESIAKYVTKKELVNICEDITAESAKTYAPILIFRKIWDQLGFAELFGKYFTESDKEVDPVEAIFTLVCNRLLAPSSKREAYYWKDEVYEPRWDRYQLHHYYRALDFLEGHKYRLEKDLFYKTCDLFSAQVDVVMFDTTSVSYWGVGKDELLQHGYAKNKRHDLKQIMVGIIMSKDGTPLGHEVWRGNMSERPAFKEIIERVQKTFQLQRVILVGDRGMVSEEIIDYLEENNLEYIFGIKMRQLNSTRRRLLLDDSLFNEQTENLRSKELTEAQLWRMQQRAENEERKRTGKKEKVFDTEKFKKYQESKKGKRRWVVCLNKKVAKEDEKKRKYFREIIEDKVAFSTAKEWIIKNGYKRYVKIHDMKVELDYSKLNEDALYDGKWVLISNTNLDTLSLILAYKDLNQIERHFRDLKSELEIGPVYHRTQPRIRAHVFVCFLALQIKVAITKALKRHSEELAYSEVMRDVRKIQALTFMIKDSWVRLRTELTDNAHHAFRAVGCAIPPKIISYSPESVVPTSA